MERLSGQMVDNLKRAAKQTSNSFKALTEGLNEMTDNVMKEGFEKMTKEDALKFRNFVTNGGFDKMFEGIKSEMENKK